MERRKTEQNTNKDENVAAGGQEVLKIQDFVKKLGGIERAKRTLDELAR